jgi:hypothetical protein
MSRSGWAHCAVAGKAVAFVHVVEVAGVAGGDHGFPDGEGLGHRQPEAFGTVQRHIGIAGMHEPAVLLR